MQHRIDALQPNTWPRPLTVTVQDGNLLCAFGPGRRYELQNSYSRSPHAQFLNVRTDESMRAFVQGWGPLYFRSDQQGKTPLTFPLAEYHAFRRRFAALHGLMEAVEVPLLERERLQEFVAAVEEYDKQSILYVPGKEAEELTIFRTAFCIQEATSAWVTGASASQVRSAIQWLVPMNTPAPRSVVDLVRRGKGHVPRTRWALDNLQETLRWMLWFDVFRKDPLYCCQECRFFFKSESRHERKFCDNPKCAKRATGRKWRKKDLKKKRLAKAKEDKQGKEKSNGTQEAR